MHTIPPPPASEGGGGAPRLFCGSVPQEMGGRPFTVDMFRAARRQHANHISMKEMLAVWHPDMPLAMWDLLLRRAGVHPVHPEDVVSEEVWRCPRPRECRRPTAVAIGQVPCDGHRLVSGCCC